MLTIHGHEELLIGSTVVAFVFAAPLLSFVGEKERNCGIFAVVSNVYD